jgi:hypothetical protein
MKEGYDQVKKQKEEDRNKRRKTSEYVGYGRGL